jgi:hypothetical protein
VFSQAESWHKSSPGRLTASAQNTHGISEEIRDSPRPRDIPCSNELPFQASNAEFLRYGWSKYRQTLLCDIVVANGAWSRTNWRILRPQVSSFPGWQTGNGQQEPGFVWPPTNGFIWGCSSSMPFRPHGLFKKGIDVICPRFFSSSDPLLLATQCGGGLVSLGLRTRHKVSVRKMPIPRTFSCQAG